MPYIKQAFDVVTFDQAKNVVLSDDPKDPKKFEKETEHLVDTIKKFDIITDSSNVLDFGCGMGRVSKKLIETFNCSVVGVDISNSMLTFAKLYVAKPKQFTTYQSYSGSSTIDVCVCTFVLQHVEDPEQEIQNIYDSLKPNGYLVLTNEHKRFVPSDVDMQNYVVWKDDGFDIYGKLSTCFKEVNRVQYMTGPLDVVLYQKI